MVAFFPEFYCTLIILYFSMQLQLMIIIIAAFVLVWLNF